MKKNLFKLGIGILVIGASILTACTKEGPMGPAGANGKDGTNGTNGTNGKDGVDGASTCTECHNPTTVDLISIQFEFSKHSYGEAAFEESGNTGCTPCHADQAFKYVCANNISTAFVQGSNGKWTNPYATVATDAYGEFGCSTCHSSIHQTYTLEQDLPALTTVAPVSMTMWGGAKTIDLPAQGHSSNLCVKCHQPRPFTNSATNGNVLNYDSLVNFPNLTFYAKTNPDQVNKLKPAYRTHTHYGTVGAVYAGMGGVEFPGESYTNSPHTTVAACQDCHMATINGRSGGHTFNAAGNFNGCDVAGCHADAPLNSSSSKFKDTQTAIKDKLNALAAKLTINGVDILNRNPDAEANLWAGKTANNYDGYLNIYDPINNPNFAANNPTGTFQNPSPSNSWSQAQKDFNATLPLITLTNAQMGAIINFQLCLREYSLGIHNTSYSKALLNNTLAILP